MEIKTLVAEILGKMTLKEKRFATINCPTLKGEFV